MGLAEQFLKAGSKVIVTGRRSKALEEAKGQFPELITHVNDASKSSEREELVSWATKTYPALNVVASHFYELVSQHANLLVTIHAFSCKI